MHPSPSRTSCLLSCTFLFTCCEDGGWVSALIHSQLVSRAPCHHSLPPLVVCGAPSLTRGSRLHGACCLPSGVYTSAGSHFRGRVQSHCDRDRVLPAALLTVNRTRSQPTCPGLRPGEARLWHQGSTDSVCQGSAPGGCPAPGLLTGPGSLASWKLEECWPVTAAGGRRDVEGTQPSLRHDLLECDKRCSTLDRPP